MNGGRIFEFTLQKVAPLILELLKKYSIKKEAIDYFILHQANRFILENIALQLDVNMDKVPCDTLTRYGNQCGASIPCTIADKLSQIVTCKSQMLLLSGFGVGLSIANVLLCTQPMYCSGLCEFKNRGDV